MANEYPTPAFGGPQYLLYFKHAKDFKEITVFSTFEDGGVDAIEHAADAPQRWEFFYNGLSETQAGILDAHWVFNRLSGLFTFQEPRNAPYTTVGTTYTNAIQYESYERPEHEKYWIQSRRVILIKYPV